MSADQTRAEEQPGSIAMDRVCIRQGFVLILLALLGGALAPLMANPRLGVGAHTIGVLGGLILVALGATRPVCLLDTGLRRTMKACWLSAAYLNWAGTMLAGLTGASFLTPIAGAGTSGGSIAEVAVICLFVVVGVTSLVGTAIAIYGLRARC